MGNNRAEKLDKEPIEECYFESIEIGLDGKQIPAGADLQSVPHR